MYNKLFAKILDSSIWLQPTPTRIVWLTFIAVMDEDGFVQFASVANVAHRAVVTLQEAEDAIRCLESPDPDSSDPDHDGRRVERVPGGWLVLNAEKHREMVTRAVVKEQTRERVRKHREKQKVGDTCVYCGDAASGNDHVVPVSKGGSGRPDNLVPSCKRCNRQKGNRTAEEFVTDPGLRFPLRIDLILANPVLAEALPVTVRNALLRNVTPSVSVSDSVSDTEEDVQASRSEALAVRQTDRQEAAGGFETFWQVYPRRTGKQAALAVWRRLRPDTSLQARILQAVRDQSGSEQWLKDGGQFIPHPRTWLSQGRWDDEPVQVPQVSEKTAKTLTAGARWLAKQQNQKENPT